MLVYTSVCFGQAHTDVDAAVGRFQGYYNQLKVDSIFEMLSDRGKSLMSLDQTKTTFKQLFSQLGEMKFYEFTKEMEGAALYKTQFAKATLSLVVSVKDNKLETFRFMPYKADSGAREKSNFILKTKDGDIHGTLTLPDGTKKVPVVLIIAGSGPTDRDGNSEAGGLKTDAYKMLADSLRKAGIAAVRYDKRGVGESAGAITNEESMRFDDIVNDAVGFIRMLKKDTRFSKVFIAGHSEGSLVGMIAAQREKVTGFISIAGVAQRADKIIEKQLHGQSADLEDKATVIMDSLNKGHLVKNVDHSLTALFRPSVQPYMISWLKYEPTREIKKLAIPVLIVQGTTDIQVPVTEAEALKKAYPKATLKVIEGMNHPLKQAPENREQNMATYNNPRLPLSPMLMSSIIGFVNDTKA